MKPYYADDPLTLIHGDCVEVMRSMDPESVDAIVTDPPYDLTSGKRGGSGVASVNLESPYGRARIGTGNGAGGFMGKAWDGTGIAFTVDLWREALRVLKPGGHLLAFGGTRTYHRMTCAIEDAGFEIRDCLMYLYGSGFPKSLDVSKAMDKAAGAERQRHRGVRSGVVGATYSQDPWSLANKDSVLDGAPLTDLAKKWTGWGTALKPAYEPIVLARKPLVGTVAANVERYGTGALNIDGTRIGTEARVNPAAGNKPGGASLNMSAVGMPQDAAAREAIGRWPANVLLDEEAAAMLDEPCGELASHKTHLLRRGATTGSGIGYGSGSIGGEVYGATYGDRGGASRFFYTAKASKSERNGSTHPTVKPVDLMRYLCRLVTPRGGLVLDPFAGSGTTGQAALAEGFRCVLIEREEEYVRGIEKWRANMQLGLGV